MSRSTRDRSPARSPHPPGRDTPKDIARRQFKEMVDALFRRFMRDNGGQDVHEFASNEGQARLLRLFAGRLTAHAAGAPQTPTPE